MMSQKEAPAAPQQNVQTAPYETRREDIPSNPRPIDSMKGRMLRLDADYGSPYTVGDAHWASLLNEIHEVRGYLKTQQKQYEDQSYKISQLLKRTPDDPGPTLLFGTSQLLGHGEILAHIPSRYTCDMLMERYFKTLDPALYFIHQPTFQKQYTEHWEDPSRTPLVWIAQLFAMMRIAALTWHRDGDEPLEFEGKSQDLSSSYRTRVADCILLADYTKSHEFLIETLVLHLFGEYSSVRDSNSSAWVLLATIIRLAMRMGYHRDPDRLPSLSPFQAEMRRRVWIFIWQADIFFSFQQGFPPMVKIESLDKILPRNIYDESFGPHCVELPAPLSDSEPTQISYLICKAQLALGLARALKELNREDTPPPYEKVLEIDRSIREAYSKAPDHLRLRSMADQQHDPMSLIYARFALVSIHHRALCVVHSRFLEAARMDTRFCNSRRACLESAMALLSLQAIQHQEFRAEGQTRSLTRYVNSLITHDYLLAATILCTELSLDRGRDPFPFPVTGPTKAEMIKSLDQSAAIWSSMRDESIEAYKASDVLGMLLKKLRYPNDSMQEAQSRIYPAPPSMHLPEAGVMTNLTQMYPGAAINAGTMALPPPQQYVPRDLLSIGYGSTLSMLPGFSVSNAQHSNQQDPSPTWQQFAAPIDFSDPVSTLWALDPGRKG
ncbi:fat storage-inducing transmembrane protein 2 [Talaromyces marneffei ATCC 18224]|nr:hypothetical protein EYB25_001435 [Talaromyces marneffei]